VISCRVRSYLFQVAIDVELIYLHVAEFAVADIEDIKWSTLPSQCLTIPNEQREVTMALVATYIGQVPTMTFDNCVAGKGKGLIILLQ
jgi:hypothetical protein